MKVYDQHRLLKLVCRLTGRWGIAFDIYTHSGKMWSFDGIKNAAPYLIDQNDQVLLEECGIILFDNEQEALTTYNQTVGDDGPTESNSWNGDERVYAIVCSPRGLLLHENT